VLLHLSGGSGDVVFALLLRDDPADVTTPYGYGGPVAVGPEPPLERFSKAYERWCAERGVVSTFAVFHPLFANHRYAPSTFRLERLGETVGWRLEGAEDPGERMHSHHRRLARKASAAGVDVTVHERPERLDDFVELYGGTMRRTGATPFYFFPDRYWDLLSSDTSLVRVDASLDGELAASLLCLASPPWLHYHLGASSERGRAVGANHLAFREAARWAHDRGFRAFHLGGGVGGRADSLLDFKRRFDRGGPLDAYIGKAVHDRERYRALTDSRQVERDDFFPAYRRAPERANP
jgi:serine/alanine adding enzyme